MSKHDEIRDFIKRQAESALYERVGTFDNRATAEIIRENIPTLAMAVAFTIAEEYRFLELADIMEWKRTRVKR